MYVEDLILKETHTPMKKRTSFLTNVPEIMLAFDQQHCLGLHEHQRIQGSEGGVHRAKYAQKYPDELCDVIIGAVKQYVGK
jgi:hypothetical protein